MAAEPELNRSDSPPVPVDADRGGPGSRRRDAVGVLVLIAFLAVFPLLAPSSFVNIGVYALIYSIAAIGLTLLMGLAGQVSLGQAGFFAIGAYTQAVLVTRYDVPGVAAAACAVVLAGVAGLLVGLPLLRLRGHYLALATLGFGIIVSILASQWHFLGATSGIFGIPKPSFLGRTYDSPAEFFWLLAPFVVVSLVLARNIVESRMGRAFGALHDSEVAAETLGVDAYRLRLQVFVLAAAYAGLAGVFFAYWLAVVNPNASNFLLSAEFLIISVVGGLGSVWGGVVGAFVVAFLDEGLARAIPALIPQASGEVQLIGFGILLVLIMIFLPGGLHQGWTTVTGALGTGRPRRATPEGRPAGEDRPPGEPPPSAPQPEAGTPLLQVSGLTKRFGGVVAVNDVSFDVLAGEIFALIGPNGAGKTTCFNMISGVLHPTAGAVTVQGTRIDGAKPHVFARNGATRTFQNLQVFGSASVVGNVKVGRHLRSRAGLLKAMLAFPAVREERETTRAAHRFTDLLGLADVAHHKAADLPFGRQRLLEVARALALEPRLLLLDEPLAGLSGAERREMADVLRRLRADGMTIVLVEHDVAAILALADRIAVLDDGVLIALGTPEEVRDDPAVISAYLGVEEDDTVVAQAQQTQQAREADG
jgi:branched-chain amino acid transport system permease protein